MRGLFTAFAPWGHKAQEGEGHNKPFLYWTRLLMNNEPLALFGIAGVLFLRRAAAAHASGGWRALAGRGPGRRRALARSFS